jgi:hypothetical protein
MAYNGSLNGLLSSPGGITGLVAVISNLIFFTALNKKPAEDSLIKNFIL